MHRLWQDVRYGIRMLVKFPVVTLVALLSLALGIAANTTMFGVANGLFFEAFPYQDTDRLVLLFQGRRDAPGDQNAAAPGEYLDWKERATSFSGVAAYGVEAANLTGFETPEQVQLTVVTPDLFDVLGVRPALGRDFNADDGRPGAAGTVILHHDFWERRFDADPGAIGAMIQLDGLPYTVIGVMPDLFDLLPANVQLYRTADLTDRREEREARGWLVMARLAPGITAAQAQAEMATIGERLEAEYPESNAGFEMRVTPLGEWFPGPTDTQLLRILLIVTALVLIIACANVANLLLARAEARQKEVAVRAALGAGRGTLIRQLLTESTLLALAAAVVGSLLATWGTKALGASLPAELPEVFLPRLDVSVLAVTLAVAGAAGLLLGLAPAFQSVSGPLREALGEGGRGGTAARKRRRLRNAFVVGQVAVALAMLTGAGILYRTFTDLIHDNPGFRPAGVLTFSVTLPERTYPEDADLAAFAEGALRELREVPGVEAATAMTSVPRGRGGAGTRFTVDGREPPEPNQEPRARWEAVSPGYLAALGAELRRGRTIEESDRADAPPVIVVNEALVRRHFPDEEVLGRHISVKGQSREVVGVVRDILHDRIADAEGIDATIYVPIAQAPLRALRFALRAAADPGALAAPARSAIWSVDPDLPVGELMTLNAAIRASLAGPQALSIVLALFGILALLLSAVGIYGVVAHGVAQRTREFGIRMALGAPGGTMVRMVTRQGLRLAALGLALGLPLAFVMYRVIAAALSVIGPVDLSAVAAVGGLLAAVSLAASWLPARRAARVEPVRALRAE